MISLLHTDDDDDDAPILQHSVMLSHTFNMKSTLCKNTSRALEVDGGKRNEDCKHCGWITLRYYIIQTRKNEKNHHKLKDTDRLMCNSLLNWI